MEDEFERLNLAIRSWKTDDQLPCTPISVCLSDGIDLEVSLQSAELGCSEGGRKLSFSSESCLFTPLDGVAVPEAYALKDSIRDCKVGHAPGSSLESIV